MKSLSDAGCIQHWFRAGIEVPTACAQYRREFTNASRVRTKAMRGTNVPALMISLDLSLPYPNSTVSSPPSATLAICRFHATDIPSFQSAQSAPPHAIARRVQLRECDLPC